MRVSRSKRIVAGALAALWLALPVAAAVHGTLEAHEYCAEHQAFEHATDGPGHVATNGDSVAATAERAGHDGCAFGEALVRTATAVDAPGVCIVGHATDVRVAPAVAPAPRAVLERAPKTSPPALFV